MLRIPQPDCDAASPASTCGLLHGRGADFDAAAIARRGQLQRGRAGLRAVFFVALVTILGTTGRVQGTGFVVKGIFRSDYLVPGGAWTNMQQVSFEVKRRAHEWLLRVNYEPEWFHEFGCNGTNVFSLVVRRAGIDDTLYTNTNAVPGVISEDDYPADGGPTATIPWLAFCSAARLDRGASFPAPWAMARETPLAYLYAPDIERFVDPLGLPSRVRFLTDASRLKAASKGSYLRRERLEDQDRYLRAVSYEALAKDRQVGGEYKVLESRQVNGINVPTRFAMTFFDHLGRSRDTAERVARIRYEGIVSEVSALPDGAALLPAVPAPRLDIIDHRLKDTEKPVDFIAYPVTNGVWPETVTAEMRQAFEARREFDIGRTLDQGRLVRSGTKVLIGFIALLPLLLMWLARQTRRSLNQQLSR